MVQDVRVATPALPLCHLLTSFRIRLLLDAELLLDAKLRLECTHELKMRLIRPGARAKHHLLDDLKEFLQMVGNVRRGRSSRIGALHGG